MKTFLKVLLILLAAILVAKLLPFTLLFGFGLGIAIVVAAALGLSAAAILLGLMVTLVAVLSPIWIPIMALVGIIALIKRLNRKGVTA